MPDLLRLFVYHEVLQGANPADLARELGLTEDWIKEHVEAARLCFKHQVVVVH